MRRDEIIARLREVESKLRTFGVGALYLFGSHARDEAQADSDVDVFVDPISEASFDFLKYMDAYETIRKSVGENVPVGYSTREGLSPMFVQMSSTRPSGSFDGGIAKPSP